jgi:hypothetical protein
MNAFAILSLMASTIAAPFQVVATVPAIKDVPANNRVYRIARPDDTGIVHLFRLSPGIFRHYQDDSESARKEYAATGAAYLRSKYGPYRRIAYIYLIRQPDSAPTVTANHIVDYEFIRPMLYDLKDMLRIGRNWRNQGVAQEDRRIAFNKLPGIRFELLQERNDSEVYWQVINTSKEEEFGYFTLTDLSTFVTRFETQVEWLDSPVTDAETKAISLSGATPKRGTPKPSPHAPYEMPKHLFSRPVQGTISVQSAVFRVAPFKMATLLRELPRGTSVVAIGEENGYYLLRLAGGRTGWTPDWAVKLTKKPR